MGLKAISFDFWNTLFTEQEGGYRLYQERRHKLLSDAVRACGQFTDEQLRHACALEAESHYQIWREEHRTLTAMERLGKILTRIEATLPEGVVAELVHSYEEGILEHPPVLVPGVREALDKLVGRYRLGIISDVGFSPGRVLKRVLNEAGLLGAFDSLVFSDEAGCSKPHQRVFEHTAAALGASPQEIVHIGDLEFTDIIGAKKAGYRAIRFTGITPMREDEVTMADHVTANFSDLPQIIELLQKS